MFKSIPTWVTTWLYLSGGFFICCELIFGVSIALTWLMANWMAITQWVQALPVHLTMFIMCTVLGAALAAVRCTVKDD